MCEARRVIYRNPTGEYRYVLFMKGIACFCISALRLGLFLANSKVVLEQTELF